MKLNKLDVGDKFILQRNGLKYKKLGYHSKRRVLVKPVNHIVGVIAGFKSSLSDQCRVSKIE